MMKQLIKQRFSKSLKTYSDSAIIQKQMAEKLVGMIKKDSYNNILELGCGTGFVTELLNKKIKYNCYDAIDIVEGCEEYIKKISNSINFINTDLEKFVPERKYDLIISNAVLQWLKDLPCYINNLKSNLNKDGIILFTVFGQNNFQQMKKFNKISLRYYKIDELCEMFSEYEIINIEEEQIELEFNTPIEVLRHIKNTGVNAIQQTHWTKFDLKNFEENYPKTISQKIQLTYQPIYIYLKNLK